MDALGDTAAGVINYWPGGQMSVVIGGSDRPRFTGAWESIRTEAKSAAYDGLVAYAGTWRRDNNIVIHSVEVCWIPNWEGRELVRRLTFLANDKMSLKTIPSAGRSITPEQEVIWRRISGV